MEEVTALCRRRLPCNMVNIDQLGRIEVRAWIGAVAAAVAAAAFLANYEVTTEDSR